MEWIIASITFGVLFLFALLYCFSLLLSNKKKEKASYDKGAGDTFDWILKAGYAQKKTEFALLNKKAKKGEVVLVGDSLTDNYPINECFIDKGYRVYNRGIGGDTTEGLKKRLEESVFALSPSVVVLLIGINDFAFIKEATPSSIASSIQAIVKEIQEKAPEASIILEGLYPVNKSADSKIDRASVDNKDNKLIGEVNALLEKTPGVIFLSLDEVLKDENGELRLDYTREGLHLNADGYFAITPYIDQAIRKARGYKHVQ